MDKYGRILLDQLIRRIDKAAADDSAYVEIARQFSHEQRMKLAQNGMALPDGSYPIENLQDLHNAMQAYGRSNPADRAKVKSHILKRAKALGADKETIARIQALGSS